MATKKQKTKSVPIEKLLSDHFRKKVFRVTDKSNVSKTADYMIITDQGFEIYLATKMVVDNEEVLDKVRLIKAYIWEDFNSVKIDKFALSTNYEFDNGFILKVDVFDDLTKSLQSNGIHITFIERKWYNKILGFRSKKKWKMITASLTYLIITLMIVGAFSEDDSAVKEASGTPKEEVNANENNTNPKNELSEEEKQKKAEEETKKETEQKLKKQLNFEGKIAASVNGNKITVSIDSNVPDGGIFEVSLVDGNFNVLSDFLEIKDGKVNKDFEIPKDWGVGHIGTMAMFRFNLPEHPQPEHIKNLYGNNGEKLSGKLAVEHNQNGKNAVLETKTVAYPSEEAVLAEQEKGFDAAIDEIINTGNGLILDVSPRYDNEWKMVNVVVSDTWYYSADHEKERFAETLGEIVQNLVINFSKTDENVVMVYFVDSYGKDLATPKVFGGYDIKR
ncbi:hypothetical protein V7127_02400 [Bacillus sp. JJ1773]|uniref:hypothetical protein n=1 Tax=Bacillus sp. JJ1773 TaxID=3122965 RepID=UPI002FFF100F